MRRFLYAVIVIGAAAVAAWIVTGYRLQHTSTIVAPVQKETAYQRVMRTGVLRCGYQAWSPFFEKDAVTGAVSGMLKDVIDQMTATIGLKTEYVEVNLGQQPQDLSAGKYDSFCFDSFLMPKASKFVDYTKPWGFSTQWIMGRAADEPIATFDSLNTPAVTFSAMDGDLSLDLVTRFFPQAKMLSLAGNADPSLLLLNVTTGKTKAVITDEITIKKFNRTNAEQLKPLYPKPIAIYPLVFSVEKGQVDLQNMLNYAVDIFVYTGNYNAILDKYDPEKYILRVDNKRN